MKKLLVVLIAVLGSGCVIAPPIPPRSALEIRQSQTREYPTKDTRMVMKALLNVLQDEGYVTKNAVMDLGLITAVKEDDLETGNKAIFNSILYGRDGIWEKNAEIEATANVSEFGNDTRVRITFKRKILSNRGTVLSIENISEPGFYQEFLAKVDKGIFIQRERI